MTRKRKLERVVVSPPDEVTERLNKVYAKDPGEPDPVLFALAMAAIDPETWPGGDDQSR